MAQSTQRLELRCVFGYEVRVRGTTMFLIYAAVHPDGCMQGNRWQSRHPGPGQTGSGWRLFFVLEQSGWNYSLA